jgi:hypothetical protein
VNGVPHNVFNAASEERRIASHPTIVGTRARDRLPFFFALEARVLRYAFTVIRKTAALVTPVASMNQRKIFG